MTRTHARILVISCLAIATFGCQARGTLQQQQSAEDKEGDSELLLKSYEVPAGDALQAERVLHTVFDRLKDKVAAQSSVTPDGQLLVIASKGVHQGVEEFLSKMAKREPQPPPPTIQLDYWFVVGQKSNEIAIAADLQSIAPALEAVVGANGPMRFDKLEGTRLSTLSDMRGEANGVYSTLEQRASFIGGKVIADLNIALRGGSKIETRLSLTPDKLIVLGETGVKMGAFKPSPVPGDGPFTLFYVVRATVRDAI